MAEGGGKKMQNRRSEPSRFGSVGRGVQASPYVASLTVLGLCACSNSFSRIADGGTGATFADGSDEGQVIGLAPDAGSGADATDGMVLQVSDAGAAGDVAPGTLAVAGHAVALTGDGSQTTPLVSRSGTSLCSTPPARSRT